MLEFSTLSPTKPPKEPYMSTKATTPRKEITTISDAQWDAVRALRDYWVGPAQIAQYPNEQRAAQLAAYTTETHPHD